MGEIDKQKKIVKDKDCIIEELKQEIDL